MSHHWREPLDPARHADHRSNGIGGHPLQPPHDKLIQQWVYLVEVASFTFQFASVEHLQECLAFFRQKLHSSPREPNVDLEHYWQKWNERLPRWLFKESKRVKVVRALERAAKAFGGPAAA